MQTSKQHAWRQWPLSRSRQELNSPPNPPWRPSDEERPPQKANQRRHPLLATACSLLSVICFFRCFLLFLIEARVIFFLMFPLWQPFVLRNVFSCHSCLPCFLLTPLFCHLFWYTRTDTWRTEMWTIVLAIQFMSMSAITFVFIVFLRNYGWLPEPINGEGKRDWLGVGEKLQSSLILSIWIWHAEDTRKTEDKQNLRHEVLYCLRLR